MLQTIVQRAPGDKPGPDISDDLLTTVAAQTQRGRSEINYNGSSRVICAGNCPASASIEPGITALITDSEKGNYHAVMDSWSLTINVANRQLNATSAVTFEREQI